MKKILVGMCAVLLLCTAAFGAQVQETILVLYNSATGTTSAVTTDAVYAPYVVTSQGCDIKTSPTGTVVVLFRGGNAYGGTETFDADGLASATTCSATVCNVQLTQTLRAMDAVITTATDTASTVEVTCAVSGRRP
jgi:hypothetical protein